MKKYLLLVLIVLACTKTETLIPKEKLTQILTEIEISKAYFRTHSVEKADSLKLLSKNSIINNNGSDIIMFDSTMKYYYKNVKEYKKLLEAVAENIKKYEKDITLLKQKEYEEFVKDSIEKVKLDSVKLELYLDSVRVNDSIKNLVDSTSIEKTKMRIENIETK